MTRIAGYPVLAPLMREGGREGERERGGEKRERREGRKRKKGFRRGGSRNERARLTAWLLLFCHWPLLFH